MLHRGRAKSSGAFSPCNASAHPYILMNFAGKSRDVMTLAHEMGHGVHQCLAAANGYLMSDTPLTLAETASVFAEMLAFRQLVDSAEDAETRRVLLAGKVEDMLNTVVRQIAFHNFETAFHAARGEGELTAGEISDVWMDTQRAAWDLPFALAMITDLSGAISRILSIRPSMSMPMPLVTVW